MQQESERTILCLRNVNNYSLPQSISHSCTGAREQSILLLSTRASQGAGFCVAVNAWPVIASESDNECQTIMIFFKKVLTS